MSEELLRQAFSYQLPAERIAQRPVKPYDRARLLVTDRSSGAVCDRTFCELPDMIRAGDLLILNDSRVLPARLHGEIEAGGGAAELLYLSPLSPTEMRCLAKPMKKLRPGTRLRFGADLHAVVIERLSEVELRVSFPGTADLPTELARAGTMPIPPYIRKGGGDSQDLVDYQTFFAAHDGSVAAPTAGLHFTPELCGAIERRGAQIAFATLHVGTASFLPLWSGAQGERLRRPGVESFVYSKELLDKAAAARARGGRIVAVGTTVVRALESMAAGIDGASDGALCRTDLFITPGFAFRMVDALITNFHQPGTTHLLLVEAFLGSELLEAAYAHALAAPYRFLSYGDGMFIV